MKKQVFTDIENTLCERLEKLSDIRLQKIKEINKKYNICLCTSATINETENFLKINNLNLNYICESGAYAKFNNLTYAKEFNLNKKILYPYKNDIIFFFYEKDEKTYCFNYLPYLAHIYPKFSEKIILNNLNDIKHKTFYQIFICIKQNVRYQFLENLEQNKIDVSIVLEDKNNIFLKLRPRPIHKGYFIPFILHDNNIKYEDTISFGDSLDDLKLFKETKIKVAVKNAEPLLLLEADAKTGSSLEDGVLNYLANL